MIDALRGDRCFDLRTDLSALGRRFWFADFLVSPRPYRPAFTMRRFSTTVRLGLALIKQSRHHDDRYAALLSALRSGTATARDAISGDSTASRESLTAAVGARQGSSVPVLQHLSTLMSLANDVLERHPGLSEAAVQVAIGELGALSEPFDQPAFLAALRHSLPESRAAELTGVSRLPLSQGIVEQTHAARLGTVPVRVTLLRADTHAQLTADLDLAQRAARLAERFSSGARAIHAAAVMARMAAAVGAMLDLRQRAADQSYLRFQLKDDTRLAVPEVFWDYCGDRVLTTGAIRGIALSDVAGLRAHGLDPSTLVATWIEAFLEMALKQGVQHAGLDASAATVSIEADTFGQLVLDATTPMMFFARHERDFLANASHALLQGDHKAAAREHLRHGAPDSQRGKGAEPAVSVEATYRREAERFTVPGGPSDGLLGDLFGALGTGTAQHTFNHSHTGIASAATVMSRALADIEILADRIAPGVDIWSIARQVIARIVADQFGPHGLIAKLADEAVRWPQVLPRLPRLVADRLGATRAAPGPDRASRANRASPGH
jgi:ubiquinone biosynthesis protein